VKAEAAALFGEKTFARIENLYKEGVIPEQQRDEAETKMKAARETANAAKAVWQKAEKGARQEDKDAANALVQRADAAIQEVQAYLDETTINAISDGEVSGINIEQGELVPTGFPVVTLLDTEDIWVTLYVREDLLSHFKMGDTFFAAIPGLENRQFNFKVNYISPTGDFARWNATKTSGEFDLKSFEIEARPLEKIEGLRPGMTAVITLDL
jgi:HlyD family secretion protein